MVQKLLRAIFYFLFKDSLSASSRWHWLKYYPVVCPDQELLARWNKSEWPEYQQWIDRRSIASPASWFALQKATVAFDDKAAISIVTPVFNTDVDILRQCILSVRYQTNPYWQLILADDGSTNEATLSVLRSRLCHDPRITVLFSDTSGSGISAASNRAILHARGEYIAFLDHDDLLSVDAINSVYQALAEDISADIIYSDRDMISPGDKRHMYLMKPGWSPETLLSGNYLFHFMCYRKQLIQQVGGLRSEYDGSQDYDLILRCSDVEPVVKHIPKVLYHWRQAEESVAFNVDAKAYAFEAGIRALKDTLLRRNINARVTENKNLWRGNYEISFSSETPVAIQKVSPEQLPFMDVSLSKALFFIHHDYQEEQQSSIDLLARWFAVEGVGIVCGKSLGADGRIVFAGGIMTSEAKVLLPYQGHADTEETYMAITRIVHNLSVPDYHCFMINPVLWQLLGGFDQQYQSLAYKLYDFVLRAEEVGWRTVYIPQAIFKGDSGLKNSKDFSSDQLRFKKQWAKWLKQGDPFYSPNLSEHSDCYELSQD